MRKKEKISIYPRKVVKGMADTVGYDHYRYKLPVNNE